MLHSVKFCPQCQEKSLDFDGKNQYHCPRCGFTFYRNVAAAVAAIIRCQGQVLFVVRAKEPKKGMLDLPGGFVDSCERAEEALRREVREELGIELGELTFFTNETNIYEYRGVRYHTLDLYYLADVDTPPRDCDRSEIADIRLISPQELDFSELAFSSTWYAMEKYLAHFGGGDDSTPGNHL